jgi:predicted RNase H-like nuclease
MDTSPPHSPASEPSIAGVDGCLSGWVVATRGGAFVADRIGDVVASFDVTGVDMPIGLPPRPGRACDGDARRLLGRRHSTIFSAPSRPLLTFSDYATALQESRRQFGAGISIQTFNLFTKIGELDHVLRATSGPITVFEVHPECSFAVLNGGPLASKHSAAGQHARLALLRPIFGQAIPAKLPGAKPNDILDAFAVLWSAERFASGEHLTLGDHTTDECGLAMQIIV